MHPHSQTLPLHPEKERIGGTRESYCEFNILSSVGTVKVHENCFMKRAFFILYLSSMILPTLFTWPCPSDYNLFPRLVCSKWKAFAIRGIVSCQLYNAHVTCMQYWGLVLIFLCSSIIHVLIIYRIYPKYWDSTVLTIFILKLKQVTVTTFPCI